MNTGNNVSEKKVILQYANYEDKKTVIKVSGNSVKFGVISDTHLGSKAQQLTHLKATYKWFKDEGAQFVLNAGDLTDGEGIYRGQNYETFIHGFDEFTDYVVAEYPNGLPTYFITGNHDINWFLRGGSDIGREIANRRSDMNYLGQMGAYVYVGKIKIYLVHGLGSPAYALSYKAQKLVEAFSSENKPNMLCVGHFHSNFVSFIRNIFACHPGSFQGQTPFLKRMAIFPVIGGYLVEIIVDKFGIARFKFEFFPCYKIKNKDY